MVTKTEMEKWVQNWIGESRRIIVSFACNEKHSVAATIVKYEYAIGWSYTVLAVFRGSSSHCETVLLHDSGKSKRSYRAKRIQLSNFNKDCVLVTVLGERQETYGILRDFEDYFEIKLARE